MALFLRDVINCYFAWWAELSVACRKDFPRDITSGHVRAPKDKSKRLCIRVNTHEETAPSGNKFQLIPEEQHANWLFLIFFGVAAGNVLEWSEDGNIAHMTSSPSKHTKFTCRLKFYSIPCLFIRFLFPSVPSDSLSFSDFNFVFGVKNFNTKKYF